MEEQLEEARRMPDAAVRFARGVSNVWTPQHLIPLRTRVRERNGAVFGQLRGAIDERLGTTGASHDYVNVFYAAAEMALMERIGRAELSPEDRAALRRLWSDLLAAR